MKQKPYAAAWISAFEGAGSPTHRFDLDRDTNYSFWRIDYIENPDWKEGFSDSYQDAQFNPIAVHEDDWHFLMCAHPWGAETAVPFSELAPIFGSNEANYRYPFITRHPKPGSFRFKPGVEKQAADYLSGHVKDALLEVPRIAFSHFHHRVNQLGHYNADLLTDKSKKEEMDAFVRTNIGASVGLTKKAATAAIEFEHELNAKFQAAGSDFRKVLAVCAEYIEGTFGVDWHCVRFFDRNRTNIEFHLYERIETEQDEEIARLSRDADRRRFGAASTHFAASSLGPLFRRFPALATIHHHAG